MTDSPLNKRHRQLDEEGKLMQQVAPGRRADNRLLVPAALPTVGFAGNPDSSSYENTPQGFQNLPQRLTRFGRGTNR
ncbi:hypothetical protein E4U52_000850, partial [Claviceps spartinae]